MADASRVAILAPNIVRDSPLPKRWHRRGKFDTLSDLDETALLARAFGIDPGNLAAAPLHYLAMTGEDPAGYCLFAYPVYLHPRREQLILMTGEDFELGEEEATALINALLEYYPHWRLERTGDAMWFIITDDDPDIETTPLQEVLGEDINDHLPRGGDAMEWVKTMNELQMILFDAEVNREREAAGQPPVNSLWIWGGGRLPQIDAGRWRRVATDDPVALGIGRRAGMQTEWLEGTPVAQGGAGAITEPGTLWVCSGAGGDHDAPSISVEQWQALRDALKDGELDELVLIDPGHGELTITSKRARSWLPWR